MNQRVFVHPGPLKTGTTYLQSLLYANRASFLAQGLTIVGDQGSHYRAANDLMRRKALLTSQVPRGAWNRTRAAVLRAPGDAVMSCERYSLFRAEHVGRLLQDFAGREVHVVLTLRDPVAVLPARWQEGIKNGGTATWAEFQESVVDNPSRLQRMTRAMSTLETWGTALPPERVHVVTVPPSSAPRTLLLERFCEAIGADPAGLETFEATRSNPSMDLATTELIRRVNAQETVALSGRAQQSEIKTFLAPELAARNRGRPELSSDALQAAKGQSQALVQRIETGGFHVIGDLADLESSTTSAPTGAGDVDPDEVLDRAAVAIATLAQRSWERGGQLRAGAARRRLPRARRLVRRSWRRLRR
ncbi:MAG TPA: hypothetical protein VFY58_04835 [Nocardioides sp.]|nr:hypothetical protein [Nocardioides sp.]